MKHIYLFLCLAALSSDSFAEMRTWTAANGKTFVGELVSEHGDKVTLKGENGKTIKVPIAGLSPDDQEYIAFNRPIYLNIDAQVDSVTKNTNRSGEACTLKVTIDNHSIIDIAKSLDLYTFTFGKNEKVTSSCRTQNISLSTAQTTFSNPDNLSSDFNREDYDDYLVLVVDSADNIVAHTSSRKALDNDTTLQNHLVILEKWRSILPSTLKADEDSSSAKAFTTRLLDCSTITRTNASGKVYRSTFRVSIGNKQGSEKYDELIDTLLAYATDGFDKGDLPDGDRLKIPASSAVLPFCPMLLTRIELLLSPIESDELTRIHWSSRRNLSAPLKRQPMPYWIVDLQGTIAYDTDITFRFVRQGTGTFIMGLDGEAALLPHNSGNEIRLGGKREAIPKCIIPFPECESTVSVGEWITLKAGEAKNLNVIMVPPNGGLFSSLLFVEVLNTKYRNSRNGTPILPLFCAGQPPSQELIDCVYAGVCPEGTKPPAPVVFKIVPSAETSSE